MRTTKLLISENDIAHKVEELAAKIAHDLQRKSPVLVGVLTGSYIFTADLTRALWKNGLKDIEIEFVAISSYGNGTHSSKNPVLIKDLKTDITGKDVLVVEDIIDTGYTLQFLNELLKSRNPKSIKTVALLSKPSKKEVAFTPDYIGFEVDGSKWVEGYGLDGGKYGRGNPDVMEVLEK